MNLGRLLFFLAAAIIGCTATSEPLPFWYGYAGAEGNGVAQGAVDPGTGEFVEHVALFATPPSRPPDKLRLSESGSLLGISLLGKNTGSFALFPLDRSDVVPAFLALGFEPDEFRAAGEDFLLGGSKGNLVLIDGNEARVRSRWSSRDSLEPSGHKPEDILVWAEEGKALLSFQKDSRSGKHRGSRLVWIDLPDLDRWVDLELPRSRPDLHIDRSRKEQGPNPEVVRIDPANNLLLATLDLYGALWTADLGTSLEGRWVDGEMTPTAADGSWGWTFPDRVGEFVFGGVRHYLVVNAAVDGGYAVFRSPDRKMVGHMESAAGAEEPVFFPAVNRVATVVSGKAKGRGEDALTKVFLPEPALHLFRLDEWEGTGPIPMDVFPLPGPGNRIIRPSEESFFAIVAVEGDPDTGSAPSILTVDLRDGSILDQTDALGSVSRLLGAEL